MGMQRKKSENLSVVSRISIEEVVDAANESDEIDALAHKEGLSAETPKAEVKRAGAEFGYDLVKFVNVDKKDS